MMSHLPSMSTRSASLITLSVEISTKIENRKVQIGSTSFHSGFQYNYGVCVCVCGGGGGEGVHDVGNRKDNTHTVQ